MEKEKKAWQPLTLRVFGTVEDLTQQNTQANCPGPPSMFPLKIPFGGVKNCGLGDAVNLSS
jgi:hypothetical protein